MLNCKIYYLIQWWKGEKIGPLHTRGNTLTLCHFSAIYEAQLRQYMGYRQSDRLYIIMNILYSANLLFYACFFLHQAHILAQKKMVTYLGITFSLAKGGKTYKSYRHKPYTYVCAFAVNLLLWQQKTM